MCVMQRFFLPRPYGTNVATVCEKNRKCAKNGKKENLFLIWFQKIPYNSFVSVCLPRIRFGKNRGEAV